MRTKSIDYKVSKDHNWAFLYGVRSYNYFDYFFEGITIEHYFLQLMRKKFLVKKARFMFSHVRLKYSVCGTTVYLFLYDGFRLYYKLKRIQYRRERFIRKTRTRYNRRLLNRNLRRVHYQAQRYIKRHKRKIFFKKRRKKYFLKKKLFKAFFRKKKDFRNPFYKRFYKKFKKQRKFLSKKKRTRKVLKNMYRLIGNLDSVKNVAMVSSGLESELKPFFIKRGNISKFRPKFFLYDNLGAIPMKNFSNFFKYKNKSKVISLVDLRNKNLLSTFYKKHFLYRKAGDMPDRVLGYANKVFSRKGKLFSVKANVRGLVGFERRKVSFGKNFGVSSVKAVLFKGSGRRTGECKSTVYEGMFRRRFKIFLKLRRGTLQNVFRASLKDKRKSFSRMAKVSFLFGQSKGFRFKKMNNVFRNLSKGVVSKKRHLLSFLMKTGTLPRSKKYASKYRRLVFVSKKIPPHFGKVFKSKELSFKYVSPKYFFFHKKFTNMSKFDIVSLKDKARMGRNRNFQFKSKNLTKTLKYGVLSLFKKSKKKPYRRKIFKFEGGKVVSGRKKRRIVRRTRILQVKRLRSNGMKPNNFSRRNSKDASKAELNSFFDKFKARVEFTMKQKELQRSKANTGLNIFNLNNKKRYLSTSLSKLFEKFVKERASKSNKKEDNVFTSVSSSNNKFGRFQHFRRGKARLKKLSSFSKKALYKKSPFNLSFFYTSKKGRVKRRRSFRRRKRALFTFKGVRLYEKFFQAATFRSSQKIKWVESPYDFVLQKGYKRPKKPKKYDPRFRQYRNIRFKAIKARRKMKKEIRVSRRSYFFSRTSRRRLIGFARKLVARRAASITHGFNLLKKRHVKNIGKNKMRLKMFYFPKIRSISESVKVATMIDTRIIPEFDRWSPFSKRKHLVRSNLTSRLGKKLLRRKRNRRRKYFFKRQFVKVFSKKKKKLFGSKKVVYSGGFFSNLFSGGKNKSRFVKKFNKSRINIFSVKSETGFKGLRSKLLFLHLSNFFLKKKKRLNFKRFLHFKETYSSHKVLNHGVKSFLDVELSKRLVNKMSKQDRVRLRYFKKIDSPIKFKRFSRKFLLKEINSVIKEREFRSSKFFLSEDEYKDFRVLEKRRKAFLSKNGKKYSKIGMVPFFKRIWSFGKKTRKDSVYSRVNHWFLKMPKKDVKFLRRLHRKDPDSLHTAEKYASFGYRLFRKKRRHRKIRVKRLSRKLHRVRKGLSRATRFYYLDKKYSGSFFRGDYISVFIRKRYKLARRRVRRRRFKFAPSLRKMSLNYVPYKNEVPNNLLFSQIDRLTLKGFHARFSYKRRKTLSFSQRQKSYSRYSNLVRNRGKNYKRVLKGSTLGSSLKIVEPMKVSYLLNQKKGKFNFSFYRKRFEKNGLERLLKFRHMRLKKRAKGSGFSRNMISTVIYRLKLFRSRRRRLGRKGRRRFLRKFKRKYRRKLRTARKYWRRAKSKLIRRRQRLGIKKRARRLGLKGLMRRSLFSLYEITGYDLKSWGHNHILKPFLFKKNLLRFSSLNQFSILSSFEGTSLNNLNPLFLSHVYSNYLKGTFFLYFSKTYNVFRLSQMSLNFFFYEKFFSYLKNHKMARLRFKKQNHKFYKKSIENRLFDNLYDAFAVRDLDDSDFNFKNYYKKYYSKKMNLNFSIEQGHLINPGKLFKLRIARMISKKSFDLFEDYTTYLVKSFNFTVLPVRPETGYFYNYIIKRNKMHRLFKNRDITVYNLKSFKVLDQLRLDVLSLSDLLADLNKAVSSGNSPKGSNSFIVDSSSFKGSRLKLGLIRNAEKFRNKKGRVFSRLNSKFSDILNLEKTYTFKLSKLLKVFKLTTFKIKKVKKLIYFLSKKYNFTSSVKDLSSLIFKTKFRLEQLKRKLSLLRSVLKKKLKWYRKAISGLLFNKNILLFNRSMKLFPKHSTIFRGRNRTVRTKNKYRTEGKVVSFFIKGNSNVSSVEEGLGLSNRISDLFSAYKGSSSYKFNNSSNFAVNQSRYFSTNRRLIDVKLNELAVKNRKDLGFYGKVSSKSSFSSKRGKISNYLKGSHGFFSNYKKKDYFYWNSSKQNNWWRQRRIRASSRFKVVASVFSEKNPQMRGWFLKKGRGFVSVKGRKRRRMRKTPFRRYKKFIKRRLRKKLKRYRPGYKSLLKKGFSKLVRFDFYKRKKRKLSIKVITFGSMFKYCLGYFFSFYNLIMYLTTFKMFRFFKSNTSKKDTFRGIRLRLAYVKVFKYLSIKSAYYTYQYDNEYDYFTYYFFFNKMYRFMNVGDSNLFLSSWSYNSYYKIGLNRLYNFLLYYKRKVAPYGRKLFYYYKFLFFNKQALSFVKMNLKLDFFYRRNLRVLFRRVKRRNLSPYLLTSFIVNLIKKKKYGARSAVKKVLRFLRRRTKLRLLGRNNAGRRRKLRSPFKGIVLILAGRVTKRTRASYMLFKRGRIPFSRFRRHIFFLNSFFKSRFGMCSIKLWVW